MTCNPNYTPNFLDSSQAPSLSGAKQDLLMDAVGQIYKDSSGFASLMDYFNRSGKKLFINFVEDGTGSRVASSGNGVFYMTIDIRQFNGGKIALDQNGDGKIDANEIKNAKEQTFESIFIHEFIHVIQRIKAGDPAGFGLKQAARWEIEATRLTDALMDEYSIPKEAITRQRIPVSGVRGIGTILICQSTTLHII